MKSTTKDVKPNENSTKKKFYVAEFNKTVEANTPLEAYTIAKENK